MAFPNADWQVERNAPRWHPVAGKPDVFTHDDKPTCEVEIVAVACVYCGSSWVAMHAVCMCPDHQLVAADEHANDATKRSAVHAERDEARRAAHETCCGQRMLRLTSSK